MRQIWFASFLFVSLSTVNAQNLLNVKVAGGAPGAPTGAAVIGSAGDVWNYFPNLSGRAVGGGVVTNATTIKDSTGATLAGVTMTASFGGGTGVGSFTDAGSFSPNPSLIMANYTYENAGTSYWLFAFTGLATNKTYMLYGMGNGNQSGQGSTWWVDIANGHGTASATANFASGSRDATLANNQGICWIKLSATTTSSGALTFRVVRLNAAEDGTGGSGREYLNAFQLQLLSAPTITGLSNQTAYVGNTVVLNPVIGGYPTPACQWLQNGVVMPNQTNSTLTLAGIQAGQNGYAYALIATNSLGAVTNSITLTVGTSLPDITNLTLNVDVKNSSGNNPYTGTAAAPDSGTVWSHFATPASGNTGTLTGLTSSLGNATTTSVTISSSGSVLNWFSDSSSGTPNPLNLMYGYLFGNTYTVTVSNLQSGTYTLYAYAHGNATAQGSTVTLNAGNGGASAATSSSVSTGFRDFTTGPGVAYVALTGTVGSSGTFTFTTAYLNGFQLQLLAAPIVIGPTNQTVVAGTSALVSPTIVTGTPPPALQWFSNNVAIADATNSSLTLNNIQYAQNGTVYSITATNPAGTVTSSMTLSVIVTPGITGLNNQTVVPGTNVTIAPTVSGVPSPTLQWQFNGVNLTNGLDSRGSTIAGSTTSTLNMTNAQIADTGTYSLIASNSAGLATNSMTLTVSSGIIAPNITGPTNQTVVQSNNAAFSASVSGLPAPTLQWFVNGGSISSATNSLLTVSNVQYLQNGYVYSLVASNSAGMATNSATLSVLVPPSISQQPGNLIVVAGGPAMFSVTASGVPPVTYQWKRNGNPIANATNASYNIASAQGSDNGAVFSVTVGNSVTAVTSSNATLTVLTAAAEAVFPSNGAVNISPDQQLRIVFSSPPQLGGGKLYVLNASDNSIFATIDTSQFQTYSMFSATITNAEVRMEQGYSFFYLPMAVYGNEVWITLTNRFAYNKAYYVNCEAGLFLDASNNTYPAITGTNTWQFSTKSSGPAIPTASTGPTNITVGLDGAGDFATLQGASDWIPQNNTLTRTISVLPGKYRDSTVFTQNRNFVKIIGTGTRRQDVQFIYLYPAFSTANGAGTLRLESSDIYVRNLTLDNQVYYTNSSVVFAGPIQTLITTGNRLIFDDVLIKGGQDTLYTISGITYFNRCEVWGSVDYIYGAALSVFDQCNIVEIRSSGGPITAPNTPYAQPYGLVFLNCTFPRAYVTNGYPYDVGASTTAFMRPWGQDGMTAIINGLVDNQFSTIGYTTFNNSNEDTCRAREYNTTLIGGGSTTTIAQRQAAGAYWLNTIDPDYTNNPSLLPTDPLLAPPTGTNNRVAVNIDTNAYTLSAIFTNAYFALNGWLPTVIPTIWTQPANQAASISANATFTVAATAQPSPSFQWLKNGSVLTGQTNTTLTVTNAQYGDAAAYSVIVSNSAGFVTSSNALLSVVLNVPTQPTIPVRTNYVTDFGAVGDGVTTNTATIQAAINATSLAGGGTVEIPAGTYLSGPLFLSNSINFQIDAGAMLQMLPYGTFPATSDFILGSSLHDIEVSGGGTIDGQGAVWWATNNATTGGITRPKSLIAVTTCTNVLVQNITFQNPPNAHLSFRYVCKNVTVDNISINTVSPSPNTDGIDCSGANVLIENSHITDGDDHIALGDGNSGNLNHDITIENCLFGNGHGISIGSFTVGGLSNLLVLNCVWTNGAAGVKVKTDIDRGGLVQKLRYINLAMTNTQVPFYFYGYYTNGGTATGVSFSQAASYPVYPVGSTTPVFNNILISNLTAVPASGFPAGIIWGRPEMCISNVILDHVNITATKNLEVYNARGVQLIDSQITSGLVTNIALFNADLTITNRTASANFNLVDGITTNGYGNSLSIYNSLVSMSNTNALDDGPLTLAASTFTISNNLALMPTTAFNYTLGSNAAVVAVKGNLGLGGTDNISAGNGFTNGNYTLMTYTGALGGNLPVLGTTPSGYVCTLNTNTVGQVKLIVSSSPEIPGNLTVLGTNLLNKLNWFAAANAASYNVKRSITNGGTYSIIANVTVTNYSDAAVNPGTTYFYVVSATNSAGESANSIQASAIPLPSLGSTNLNFLVSGNQFQLSWPQDHLGWRLQIQTNNLNSGLGTNWFTVPGSSNIIQTNLVMNPNNGSVFLRLIYP